jgi:hypothetical protein
LENAKKEEPEMNDEKREKENKIEGKKKGMEVSGPVLKPNKDTAAVEREEEEVGCTECCEAPWVWVSKEEGMQDFNNDINGHLPRADWPPNNVQRRKVYCHMVLNINEGGTGKGLHMRLPKCIENGVCKLFPSPTFMGFMTK